MVFIDEYYVKKFGPSSAHVILPGKLVGKKVRIELIEEGFFNS